MIVTVWFNGENRSYILDAVPQVGHMLVLDREINVVITKVIWSLNRVRKLGGGYLNHTPPPDSECDNVDVYTRVATKEEEECR
jgi:hypothetical protein